MVMKMVEVDAFNKIVKISRLVNFKTVFVYAKYLYKFQNTTPFSLIKSKLFLGFSLSKLLNS